MLSNKLRMEIDLVCYATVSHMFATMHNPVSRGEKFKWEHFPTMMRDLCQAQAGGSVVTTKKNSKEVEELAGETGHRLATKLVCDAGYSVS